MKTAAIGFLVLFGDSVHHSRAEPGAEPRVRVLEENGFIFLLSNGIPEYTIIQGDILVPLGVTAATYDTDLWDDARVRYEFADNVPPLKRALMLSAFATMEQISAIHFTEGKSIFDSGITIESTSSDDCPGCDCVNNATVGETFFGHMNICSWGSTGTLLHELGHVLNLWHEQSRPDRNAYVRVNLVNVPDDLDHNFEMEDDASVYGPYDFASLMHYGQCDFAGTLCPLCPNNGTCADGGRTVVVLPPYDVVWQNQIGTTNDLSYLDRITLSFLYPEADWRFVDQRICDFCDSATCIGNSFFCRIVSFPPLTAVCPACSFVDAYEDTPAGGTLWILEPGSYPAVGTYSKALIVQAPLGAVVLGN